MESISGKVALVTGATKGLGREISRQLALEGARVVAAARSTDALAGLVDEIGGSGGNVVARAADLSDPSQCDALVRWTAEEMGGLDILVNNAGLGFWGPVESMTDEHWLHTMRVNLDAVFYLSRAAIAPMKRAGRGHIVSIASVAGRRGVPGMAAYSTSKAAVINFTEALAHEVKGYGIQVSVVSPGTAATEFRVDHEAQGRPLGPALTDPDLMLTSEDVASAVLWVLKAGPHVVSAHVILEPKG